MKSCLFAVLLVLGVSTTGYSASATPLNVYTVNYPLAYFAERIGEI